MDRRTFLKQGALGVAGLALGCTEPPLAAAARGGRDADVLVIGGGIAGLVAAHRLAQAGRQVIVLEAADRVGGRMHTERVDGYVIDAGANFLSSTYGVLLPLIEAVGLGPRLVDASPYSATLRAGRPRRIDRRDPNTLLTSGLLDVPDFGVLGGRFWADAPAQGQLHVNDYAAWRAYDDADALAWSDGYYTPQVTQYIVEPMIQAFYFQSLAGTSRALPVAVLAHAYHQPVTRALRDGIAGLPQRLARLLDVRLGVAATELEARPDRVVVRAGGRTYTAAHAVVAAPSSVARRLHRSPDAVEARLLATGYASTVVVALATDRKWPDAPGLGQALGLAFPAGERDLVAAVGIESNKHSDAAADGELLNVYLTGAAGAEWLRAPEPELCERVVAELAPYFPGLPSSIRFTRTYRWAEAEPLSPPGRSRDVHAYRTSAAARRVWLAGDYMNMPWTEGAADAGAFAAGRILAGA